MSGSGRALLFDIDGTLADTDALHLQAFNRVFAPYGHVFDRDRASKELMGFSNSSISERFLPGQSPERQAATMAQKEETFRKLASGQLKPLSGLMALLDRADRAGVPTVAVTNAPSVIDLCSSKRRISNVGSSEELPNRSCRAASRPESVSAQTFRLVVSPPSGAITRNTSPRGAQ